jgi:hypothetical protein
VSPDGKLLAVVGDDRDALLVDSRNGEVFCLLFTIIVILLYVIVLLIKWFLP